MPSAMVSQLNHEDEPEGKTEAVSPEAKAKVNMEMMTRARGG